MAMTQVVLNIDSKKKWDLLKAVLESMNIDYTTHVPAEKISDREIELLEKAKQDIEDGRVSIYTNHRNILGR